MALRRTLVYATAFVVSFGIATLGGQATQLSLLDWYPSLAKPWFNPPNWAFPVAWTILFAMIAISGARIVLAAAEDKRAAYAAFAIQMGLNLLWSIVFFALRSPGWAILVVVAFWLAIAATIAAAWRVDRLAAFLLAPYLAWVSFATVLNIAIWRLN